MMRISRLIGPLLFITACRGRSTAIATSPAPVSLRADSAQYSVRVNGPFYRATIGFTFVNTSGRTLSANYCNAPTPPALEKQREDGTWVHAYSPVQLLCQTLPPFRIPDAETYQGTLTVAAGRPGTNIVPRFDPDSVPGTYRLRWELRAGPDPDDRAVPMISATSPSFRLYFIQSSP